MKKIAPNMPKNMSRLATLASANVRLRKKRIGSIGCSVRSSHATKHTSSAAPATNEPTMPAEVQPTSLARTSPHTIPTRPALARARPGRSSRDAGPRLSSSRSRISGASTSPIGTLSQKIQCQEMPLTIAPPTSGPSATARPLIPPQMPSASPRRSAGTEADRIVSVNGITIAPPRPWAARATSSAKIDGASAAAADATVKIAMPITSSRRRPNRSPNAAPVNSSTANVSVYALTVH